jgi:hypothetical protein
MAIRRLARLALVPALLLVVAGAVASPPASASDVEDARPATPWIVTIGDSYISGEAGRWAGSSNESYTYADALGPTAYYDNPGHTAELIPRCHRSRSAEAYLGRGVKGVNFACSGASAESDTTSEGYFKPGLDFYDDGAGHLGQARMLQDFAATHYVPVVVVSIGGNDFGFADIVAQCVLDFLTSRYEDKDFCSDDSSVTSKFTPENLARIRGVVANAIDNVRAAMTNAGYGDDEWTLLLQSYPSPLPDGGGFRYSEKGFTRQFTGGCGFWDADATWANHDALPTINKIVRQGVKESSVKNVKVLNVRHALDGRRLCEKGVGLYEEVGLTSLQQPGAVDKTEWVNQIRITADDDPYYLQESIHPNYWAQMAFRSCVRQAYDDGAVRGGKCTIAGTGLKRGEPRMKLR